jgi:hypothetical protein
MYNELDSRPIWYSYLQDMAKAVGGAEHLVQLDPQQMIEAAQASSGLSDFGPDTWQQHYQLLVKALNEEANLNLVGRLCVRTEMLRGLRNRLQLQAMINRNSEILEEKIEKPIFIGGFGRTGTSVTQELFNVDPNLRAPLVWEAHQLGDESVGGNSTANRIRQTHSEVQLYSEIAPEYMTMHENDAEQPSECAMIQLSEFLSANWGGFHLAPSYDMHSATADWTDTYRFQKRYMQALQWQSGKRQRWILKTPGHEGRLEPLFEVFPDADVIHTHRDPAKVLGSMLSLLATLRWMRVDEVPTELFPFYADAMAERFDGLIEERESGRFDLSKIHNLNFNDLMADPGKTMENLYETLGMNFDADREQAVKSYLENSPRGKHGKHQYTLEQFGYTAEGLHKTFERYMKYFNIPQE